MLRSMANQEIQTRHHKVYSISSNTDKKSKLGRFRVRHKMFKAVKTKNRMRIKEADRCSTGKLYIRDLKRYQVQRNNKVPGSIIKQSSCYNNLKKNRELLRNKVADTLIDNSSVYYNGKRYHLN